MRDRGVGTTRRARGGGDHGARGGEQLDSQIGPVGRVAAGGRCERRNRRELIGGEGHAVDVDGIYRGRADVEGVERGLHVGLRIPKHHHERAARLGSGGERADVEGQVERDVVHAAIGIGGRKDHVERITHDVAAEDLPLGRDHGPRVGRTQAERRVRDRRHDEPAAAGDVVDRVPLRLGVGVLRLEQGHAREGRAGEVFHRRRDRHVIVAVAAADQPLEEHAGPRLTGNAHDIGHAVAMP